MKQRGIPAKPNWYMCGRKTPTNPQGAKIMKAIRLIKHAAILAVGAARLSLLAAAAGAAVFWAFQRPGRTEDWRRVKKRAGDRRPTRPRRG
jgi:hypothetical protein